MLNEVKELRIELSVMDGRLQETPTNSAFNEIQKNMQDFVKAAEVFDLKRIIQTKADNYLFDELKLHLDKTTKVANYAR